MARIVLQGYIEVPAADLEAVAGALPDHIRLTRAEPGCLVFEVTQDPDDPGRFAVYEEFASKAAFDHHQQRTQASPWWRVTATAARHYTVEQLDHDA